MYFFFITDESVLDNVELPEAKEEDDNIPYQISSLVEKRLKVELSIEPCIF